MRILPDQKNKTIKVYIPLTKHTGKVRIKKRSSYTEFGVPVATRQESFSKNMYVEWQISYDTDTQKNTTLREFSYVNLKKEKRFFYELSEFLFYFYKWNAINKQELDEVLLFIENLRPENLIENRYDITRTYPKTVEINGFIFHESKISYPQLTYDFNNGFFVIAEIVIREKQKAIGIQPMVYLCFPVSYLLDIRGFSLIGRSARENEEAIFVFTPENAFIVKDLISIFGMLSERHRHDMIEILKQVLKS